MQPAMMPENARRLARSRWCGGEFQRDAVHTVAQAGGLRPVGKDVTEMPAAAAARDGGADHAERTILGLIDGVIQRRPKARPAGAAFEFGFRREQRQVAAGAAESAGAMFAEQRT